MSAAPTLREKFKQLQSLTETLDVPAEPTGILLLLRVLGALVPGALPASADPGQRQRQAG